MIRKLVETPFLYLFIFAIYLIGLAGLSVPLTGDEKVYLSIALEMRERGEWITPYLFNAVNFLKPPLEYWATLIGWKIFGLSLFGALLPSLLALIAATYFVNRVGDLISNSPPEKKNYLPGLFFASALGTMTYGTTAQMEIWIVCFYLWAWKEFLQNHYLRAFLVVGVMAWIKGPLYPVLWVLSAALWFYLQQQKEKIISRRFLGSLALGIAVSLIWYFLAAKNHSAEMMDVFFKKENMGKFQTNQGNAFSLWAEFLYSLFPWLFLFLAALTQTAVKQNIRQHWRFYLSFALIPALFFSFFPYHVNTYLYLLTPFFAWVTASMADHEKKNGFAQTILLLPAVLSIFLMVLLYRLATGNWIGVEIAIPLGLVLLVWSWFSFQKNAAMVALLSLFIVNLIRVGAVELGEKDIGDLRLAHESNPAPLAYYLDVRDIWHEYGLFSAALGQPIQRLYEKSEIPVFLAGGGIILFQDRQVEEDSSLIQNLKCHPWSRLKKRMKFPLKTLLLEGIPYGDPRLMRNYFICTQAVGKST
jgi:4-amino-4-deoxy-L-arabinose transferase-like glycosyltransferase